MNTVKAMYPINLKNDGQNDRERNVANVNQERLNDNFRTIADALIDLYKSGDHTMKYLSARIESDSSNNRAAILMLPDSIMQQVADTINGYVQYGDTSTEVQQAVASLMAQSANEITLSFSDVVTTANENAEQLSTLSSWVRIVAANAGAGTNAGVIIGSSESSTSFKAEAACIFFYGGDDSHAKWANALAGLDADGNFMASRAHLDSTLLGSKFDVDVVPVSNINFLHITGRGS